MNVFVRNIKGVEWANDKAVERANELLDDVERMREEWERSREIIESAKQMRIAADGYISTLEEANRALAECVNGALEEMERLQISFLQLQNCIKWVLRCLHLGG